MTAPRADAAQTDALAAPFLGVSCSLKGNVWRDRLAPERLHLALAMAQRHDIPEVLGRMLAARLDDPDQVPLFLNPTIRDLMPDPSLLRDMDKGAGRIAEAIEKRQNIVIFGDYDVDGGTSSALWQRFLAAHGRPCRVYIPDRMKEGYGPNTEAMRRLAEEGAQLIITVDCGSTAHAALAAATEKGSDVIVVDHHQVGEDLPAAYALINPNRPDDLSGQGDLSAAGVVFLVLAAVVKQLRARGHYGEERQPPDLLKLLDLVALSTICDVVPLTGLNRAYVQKGLAVMRHRQNAGLRALADVAGLQQAPDVYHLGFILGPRINAGGRIGDSGIGARLLACDDDAEAARLAAALDRYNSERKAMEGVMVEEAAALAERQIETDPDRPAVLVGSPDWHRGLVGLIAGRLVERFKRPAFAIAWEGGEGTGSARSVAGMDVGAAIRAAVARGLAIKGGGHAMAGGLTVMAPKLEALGAFLNAHLIESYSDATLGAELLIDGALTPLAANEKLMEQLDRAGPYGNGNPAPRFVFPAHRVGFAKIVGVGHVRCSLQAGDGSRIDAVAFRAADTPLGAKLASGDGLPLHVAGSLKRSEWGGRTSIELTIDDAADPRQRR